MKEWPMPAYDPKFNPGDKVVGFRDGDPYPCTLARDGQEYEIQEVLNDRGDVRLVGVVGAHPAREWTLAPVPEPEPPFKPGDRVRRVRTEYDGVAPGDEATVKRYDDAPRDAPWDSWHGALYLVGHGDTAFHPRAFEKIEPEPEPEVTRWNVKAIARIYGKPTAMTTEEVRALRDTLTDRLESEDRLRAPYALKDVKVGPLTDGAPTAAEVAEWAPVSPMSISWSVGPTFTQAPQDEDDFDAYAEDPAEQGWTTVPGDSPLLGALRDSTNPFGLEVRVQTRPKLEQPQAEVTEPDLATMRAEAVRSGIEQAIEALRRDNRNIAADRVEAALLGEQNTDGGF
jgi:hypothetical protein